MITTLLILILVLGILIFVHELGHFTVAKWIGIKVEEFGFGLPPRIIGKKFGETIYSLNWLPIGGFVRMYGEDEHDTDSIKSDRARAFFMINPLKRTLVLIAGVTMNFLLGWIILTYLLTQGVLVAGDALRIQEIVPGSPAALADLQEKDIISQIKTADGVLHTIQEPADVTSLTKESLGKEMILTIVRGSEQIDVSITPRSDAPEGEGAMGVVISNYVERTYSWFEAPVEGFLQSVHIMKAIFLGFYGMFDRLLSGQSMQADITGPVGIGKLVGEARQFGVQAILELMAILSFNLAFLNILPFPALDGGRLIFVIIEAVVGRPVKPQWEKHAHQIGMALLLLFLLLITINDLVKLVRG